MLIPSHTQGTAEFLRVVYLCSFAFFEIIPITYGLFSGTLVGIPFYLAIFSALTRMADGYWNPLSFVHCAKRNPQRGQHPRLRLMISTLCCMECCLDWRRRGLLRIIVNHFVGDVWHSTFFFVERTAPHRCATCTTPALHKRTDFSFSTRVRSS